MTQYAVSFCLNSFVMGIIIVIFLIFSKMSMKVIYAKFRYAIWVVILLGLIIPMSSITNNGFITVQLPAETITNAMSETMQDEAPAQQAPLHEANTENANVNKVTYHIAAVVFVCFLVCGIIAMINLAYQICRYLQFVRFVFRWGEPVTDENILSIFNKIKIEIGLHNKKIELRLCESVSTSLLTGFLRPVIVLPKKYFEADELELIFQHELTHFKHGDLFIKLLAVIAVSIHWFNPIVYLMYLAMQADGEAFCDEAVLQDADEENRKFYAELMIKLISRKNAKRTLLSTCFYSGRKSVKRRLGTILDSSKKIKSLTYAMFIIFVMLTLLSCSVFAYSDYENTMLHEQFIPILKDNESMSFKQIKEIALAEVGGGAVALVETKNDLKGEIVYYTVTITYNESRYEVDVDRRDGAVKNIKAEWITTVDANVSDISGTIEADRAKIIATKNVDGVVIMCKLENEPLENIFIYHIHVAKDETWKYCMFVDAVTGSIYRIEQK